MARATARHILVSTEAKCNELKAAIEGGADFAQVAKENSTCPSSRQGGDLGSFGPGQMVKEFDTVVFSAPLNVAGPGEDAVRLSPAGSDQPPGLIHPVPARPCAGHRTSGALSAAPPRLTFPVTPVGGNAPSAS